MYLYEKQNHFTNSTIPTHHSTPYREKNDKNYIFHPSFSIHHTTAYRKKKTRTTISIQHIPSNIFHPTFSTHHIHRRKQEKNKQQKNQFQPMSPTTSSSPQAGAKSLLPSKHQPFPLSLAHSKKEVRDSCRIQEKPEHNGHPRGCSCSQQPPPSLQDPPHSG